MKRRRLLLSFILLSGLVFAIDHWLPNALVRHYNRPVVPTTQLVSQMGLEPEVLAFSVDYEQSGPVTLTGWLIPAVEGPEKIEENSPTLIVLHSLGGTRQDVLEFALPFREAGFNLV